MAMSETSKAAKSSPLKRKFSESIMSKQSGSAGKAYKKTRKREDKGARAITHDRVLQTDLIEYMRSAGIDQHDIKFTVPEKSEVDVTIFASSSTGDGLGRVDAESSQIFVVPFTIPGDVAHVKLFRHISKPIPHSVADFISIVKPSPDRDDKLIGCRYFGKCSGCQYQMLPYEKQLAQKRTVVEKAFRHFSDLPPELVPTVGATHASPLQYGFRTKLTPHFDGPRGPRRQVKHFEEVPPIGFMRKDTNKVMDIEECPIGSPVLQYGLKRERQRVIDNLDKYTKGATLLLRESTMSREIQDDDLAPPPDKSRWDDENQILHERRGEYTYAKRCITTFKDTSTDYIDDYKLSAPSNSFFQNNNSILPSFIDYIRTQITRFSQTTTSSSATSETAAAGHDSIPPQTDEPVFTNLIDAYCGTGLFSITLSNLFTRTIGIDIDANSIASAQQNITPNAHLLPPARRFPSSQTTLSRDMALAQENDDSATTPTVTYRNSNSLGINFIAATASALFDSVKDFKAEETCVILDPPRKGCDESFLMQLTDFAPELIVYVSCNVHTQARDCGWLVRGGPEEEDEPLGGQELKDQDRHYDIVSLKGFDFFPQTAHVEGVAVLRKRKRDLTAAPEAGS